MSETEVQQPGRVSVQLVFGAYNFVITRAILEVLIIFCQIHVFFGTWSENAVKHARSIGFENKSVLCYRNSALEVLLHLPIFVNMLTIHGAYCEVDGKECILCGLARLSRLYWLSDSLTDEISAEVQNVWELCQDSFWNPEQYNPKNHQDVPEFLTGLISQVIQEWDDWAEEDSQGYGLRPLLELYCYQFRKCTECRSSARQRHPIANNIRHMFQSVTKHRDSCVDCGHVTYRGGGAKSVIYGTIPPQNNKKDSKPPSIYDFLDGSMFSRFEKECKNCERRTSHHSSEIIEDPSEVLFVQILRFQPNRRGVVRDTAKVRFPEELDMTPYTGSHTEPGRLKYNLGAVVSHEIARGGDTTSTEAGHYTCHVKGPTGAWCLLDNEIVEAHEDSKKAFNPGNRSCVPYLLVYTRQPPAAEKQAPPHQNEEQPSDTFSLKLKEPDEDKFLPASLYIGADVPSACETAKPLDNRWQGHQAKILLEIQAGETLLNGHLKGIFRKAKKGPLARVARPTGIIKQ